MLTEKFYREFAIFICFYRKALKNKGYELTKKIFKEEKVDSLKSEEICQEGDNFCKFFDMRVTPILSNSFLTQDFPCFFESLSQK